MRQNEPPGCYALSCTGQFKSHAAGSVHHHQAAALGIPRSRWIRTRRTLFICGALGVLNGVPNPVAGSEWGRINPEQPVDYRRKNRVNPRIERVARNNPECQVPSVVLGSSWPHGQASVQFGQFVVEFERWGRRISPSSGSAPKRARACEIAPLPASRTDPSSRHAHASPSLISASTSSYDPLACNAIPIAKYATVRAGNDR